MNPLLDRIGSGDILISDGALGTMLFEAGLEPGQCPDMVVLEKPELLQDIARRYIEAGSDIVHTNTFGATPLKLSDYALQDKTGEINKQAVAILKEIAGDRAYVSGSCGPSGRILKPYGDIDPAEVLDGYRTQMETLISAGADLLCIETMIDLREALLAVEAARSVSADIPVMTTLTFEKTPGGFFTIWGSGIEESVTALQEAGANVVGSNCGNGIEIMVEIARAFRAATRLPLLIQSNAGQPEARGGEIFYSETPELFAEKAVELKEIGVSVIGGCCGTTPDHIRAIRAAVG
jgi:5-methyltetrahydrofolate--homocysteine methyltransferase